MRKSLFLLPLLAILALGAAPLDAAAQSGAQKGKPGDDPVVAKVNGHEIRFSEVEEIRRNLPPQAQQYPMAMIFDFLINSMINTRLAAEEARRQGYLSEAPVKRRLERAEDQVLEQAIVARYIEDNMTDAALKARYEKFVSENPPVEEVRARHILLESEAEAKAVIGRLGKGEDFAALARELSIGPSGKSGGDLNYFTRERMVPEFSEAAFRLDTGAYTREPVQTQFGWHVIKVEDKRTQQPPSFADAEGALREEMSQQLAETYHKELREGAEIETFGPGGK